MIPVSGCYICLLLSPLQELASPKCAACLVEKFSWRLASLSLSLSVEKALLSQDSATYTATAAVLSTSIRTVLYSLLCCYFNFCCCAVVKFFSKVVCKCLMQVYEPSVQIKSTTLHSVIIHINSPALMCIPPLPPNVGSSLPFLTNSFT